MTDSSGVAPHSEAWLKHWDHEIFKYMQDPEHRRPKVLFSLQAFRAVMQWTDNPASLVGSLCDEWRRLRTHHGHADETAPSA